MNEHPWRSFFFMAFVEVIVYTFLTGFAWAIFSHDPGALERSASDAVTLGMNGFGLTSALPAGLVITMLALTGVLLGLNLLTALLMYRRGRRVLAVVALPVTAAVASLFFLPVFVSLLALGSTVALLTVIWLFAKLFRRRAPSQSPSAKATGDKPKTAAKPPSSKSA